VKLFLCPLFPDIPKNFALFEGCPVNPLDIERENLKG
jgi:hypothetical protein